jgi:nickel/cobalt transporter (NicO) family protein
MTDELIFLAGTAASIAFLHTVMGPDHFLPFVAMGKTRGWSKKKLASVTVACGLAHSLGSILLGLFGIWAGTTLGTLKIIEGFRGDLAAWCLLSFGILYTAYGIRKAIKDKAHSHIHSHADGTVHNHSHKHHISHAHLHSSKSKLSLAPWTLFIIFVLGPCEPLIPLMMYPAATASAIGMALVVGTFVVVTVVTMTLIALTVFAGMRFVAVENLHRYKHAITGSTLSLCGFAIIGLGV